MTHQIPTDAAGTSRGVGIMSSLRSLVDLHGVGPVNVLKPLTLDADDAIVVDLPSVELLELFADAVEKPVVSGDGETFAVAYEVDGVPTLWRATFESKAVAAC